MDSSGLGKAHSKNWRYRRLFWSIVVLFIFTSFFRIETGGLITSTLLTITILLMLKGIVTTSRWKLFLKGLVVITLGFDVLTLYLSDRTVAQGLFTLADIVYAVFLGVAVVAISKELNKAKKVDQDILLGAISVYLLIGILWFLLYRISFMLNADNFESLQVNDPNDFILLYFSFTTLTTLGYGDITPTDSVAMGLSNMEAIIGQMYPAVFVARLVSIYTTDFEQQRRNDLDEFD